MIRTFTRLLLASSALVPIVLVPMSAQAQELPTGGQVVGGSAVIGAPNPGSLSIHQGSDRAIINWQSFSIGEGGRVDVYQPGANSVLLNRVTGATTSRIAGALNANGQVFVVNPNGILITSTGSVNAGGFVASTLNITDDRFMMGNILMSGQGGEVRNEGTINIVRGGYAALIGGSIDNSGLIAAPLGWVGLGAGSQATLDLNGDGFLQIALPAAGEGGVTMSGRISADGGAVLLTAASAVDAARRTVNLSGVIEARGVEGRNGSVVLTGPNIQLSDASIDVSGPTGGGTVKIGGDHKGAAGLQRASTLTVDAASTIRADATESGKGGDVVLWSDRTTRFDGLISARGAGVGSGGNAEVSSAGVLHYTGVADLRGATFGTLLLDPYNVVISNGVGSGGFTPSQNDSVINTTTLQNALALANVTIETGGSGSPGAQVGDITIASALTWASGSTLTLDAYHGIFINAAVTITGAGGLALGYDATSAANLKFGAGGRIDFGATDSGGRLSINGDTFKLIYSLADLQAINNDADLKLNYALATSMDAAGIDWDPLGVDANGNALNNSNGLSGTFTGLGNTISNLEIDRSFDAVGLVGLSFGAVRDIGLVGGSVKSAGGTVGALVGMNYGAVVNAFASTAVSGGSHVGGLVGISLGSITGSYATGAVTGDDHNIGGLVGTNGGSVEDSYATGDVSGGDDVYSLGGLAGSSEGTWARIKNSHATGKVSGGNDAYGLGGLVGYNDGIIDQAYATGAVSGLDGAGALGGLVGSNSATGVVTNADAKGAVTGGEGAFNLGGLAGENYGSIATGTASGNVTGGDEAAGLGGLVGQNYGSIDSSIAAGAVSGGFLATLMGGLVGTNEDPGFITLSHATGAVTGGNEANNVGGLVGSNRGSIDGSYASGAVTGGADVYSVGGLVGSTADGSSIKASYATGDVSVGDHANHTGGFVGFNLGLMDGSYATGAVTGADDVTNIGGLVGTNGVEGVISKSKAYGMVTSGDRLVGGGGLVGTNEGSITEAFAYGGVVALGDASTVGGLVGTNFDTGRITNSGVRNDPAQPARSVEIKIGDSSAFVGGLVGVNSGLIENSQAAVNIVGGGWLMYAGGLVGWNRGAQSSIKTSRATGNVTGGAGSFVLGGLVGDNYGGIIGSSASGAVSGGLTHLGGLVGRNNDSGTVTGSTASGAVSTTADDAKYIGGLVGQNLQGSIAGSDASGAVSTLGNGVTYVGGLVGSNEGGGIAGSSASGAVSGGLRYVGGLVGGNSANGTIARSTSSGVVRTTAVQAQNIGGLVGGNDSGSITDSSTTASASVTATSMSQWVGGLVGSNRGVISGSSAAGNVTATATGSSRIGGLVGNNFGAITGSSATGVIRGVQMTGGLVGYNTNAAITSSHATGAVSGTNYVGGLVGNNDGGVITLSSATLGVITGGQYVGGLVGSSSGAAARITSSRATGKVTGGANSSYVGGLVGINDGLAGISESTATGDVSGGGTSGLYIGGLVGGNRSGAILNSTASGNVTATAGTNNVGGLAGGHLAGSISGSEATGSVTVGNNAMTVGGFVGAMSGVNTTITNSKASGVVTIGNAVTNTGGFIGNMVSGSISGSTASGAVNAGNNASNLGGFIGINNGVITGAFANGSVTAGLTAQGVAGFAGFNGQSGSITGSNATGAVTAGLLAATAATGPSSVAGFVGLNRGKVTDASSTGAVRVGNFATSVGGFVGYNNDGAIKGGASAGSVTAGLTALNIGGFVGNQNTPGSITGSKATGDVTAGLAATTDSNAARNMGGFAGNSYGTITDASATGAVRGGPNANSLGGFIGYNLGALTRVYATGAVSGGANSAAVGGLIGTTAGANSVVKQSYSTGLVTTGAGSGGVGGLVGIHQGGSLSQVFSTGAVYGGLNVGGLVGGLAGGATITEAFATGFVSSGGAAGGLVGRDIGGGAITNSYWDTQTTGQATTASGGAGQTTAQLQGVLPTLFNAADWGTGTGLYPYLKVFFPNGVQVISGTAYKADGSVMASNLNGVINVSVASGGGVAGSASTGANGYFYIFAAPGTWSDASGVGVFTQADAVTGSQAGVSYRAGAPNAVLNAGMDLTGGWRRDYAGAVGSLTGLDAGYATAIGTTAPQAFVLNSRQIDASGAFAIDRDIALSNDGVLWLTGAGPVSQTGGSVITASKLLLSGPGQFTLTGANLIGELAANAGQVNLFSTSGLTISGGVKNANGVSVAGVSTSGSLRLATAGNLTLAAGGKVSGADPTLATNGAFINNQGSDAVTATSGRWLIYAARPTGNVFGGLDSGNTAIWNTSALGAVSASGNRYVFAYQPTLTVTTGDLTKTYGEDATARLAGLYTVTGFEAGVVGAYRGDTAASILSGAASVASTGAVGTANVGGAPYAITATTGTLAAADGYTLSFANTGRLSVNQRALTVTADALSRIYGEANPTLTYTVGGLGLVNGDSLSGALATTADVRSNVGTYAITQGSLGASGNYAINFQSANLTVLQRALTVTADALSRIYGEANPTLTYTLGGLGLVNGDSLSGALATTADVRSNVGIYAITQGSLGASGNYAINFQSANLTVLQRALTVTADALSRIYGEANPALTYTVGGLGLVNGDTLSGGLATAADVRSNVGAYAITQGTLGNANYAVTYQGANLTVGQRALTLTADALSRIYGEANPTLTYRVGGLGLVNGDSLSGALATTADARSNVGTYAITQGSLGASGNYAINFQSANLTVLQRALTVTADALSRIYGEANPTLTYTVGGLGLVNGDSLSGALATAADVRSNVGAYAITQGTLGNANYAVTYQGANLTVGQRALTVKADALSRIYGEANPTLTYTVGGLGLVNGDSLSGALATTADVRSNVGTYAITQGSLGASSNYAVTFQGALLSVGQRSLILSADALSRAYGAANPPLTYRVGGLGLVNGDTLSGALATSATVASNPGAYAITQGTLAASANYAVTYQGADLTVQRPVVPAGYWAGTQQRDALINQMSAKPELSTLEYSVDDQGVVTATTHVEHKDTSKP